MTERSRYMAELRQQMNVCIATYYRLSGVMPDADELFRELGNRYEPVIAEYARGKGQTPLTTVA